MVERGNCRKTGSGAKGGAWKTLCGLHNRLHPPFPFLKTMRAMIMKYFHLCHPTGLAKSMWKWCLYVVCMCVSASSLQRWSINTVHRLHRPIHILKAHDKSCSKIISEHNYKDNDKDNDKIPETANIWYIFEILMTHSAVTHSKYDDMIRWSSC